MENIEKIDDELYISIYGLPRVGNYIKIWDRIKNDKEILKEAIKVKRNKWNSGDIVNGLAIADAILKDYENIDKQIYGELINNIYTNKDIARIVLDGVSNGGYSFLLMSLWNHNLKLTDEQKAFAVSEAMNKVGTIRWAKKCETFSKKLDDAAVNNSDTVFLEFGGSINPIGKRDGMEYLNNMSISISDEQAHGVGAFDIRYQILRNPNWTLEEKQKLVMDFWCNYDKYDECLDEWEWSIVNDAANICKDYLHYGNDFLPILDKDDLFELNYEDLIEFYGDKIVTDRIYNEINFCKQMHELRPTQYELEFKNKQKTI